jgi:glucoamylase
MKSIFLITGLLGFIILNAAFKAESPESKDITQWLAYELPKAETYMTANISPNLPGYKKGFVTAAPWVVPGIQDYRYHWVRDAALAMNTILTRYISAKSVAQRTRYFEMLKNYIQFSKDNQTAAEPDDAEKVGLGEVKFNPDGTRFTKWMRPQNDGPALRPITVIRFARQLLRESKSDLARYLYDGNHSKSSAFNYWNAAGLIKADLDFVGAHWRDPSYDPWEEVRAQHFYTAMVPESAFGWC